MGDENSTGKNDNVSFTCSTIYEILTTKK